MREEFPVCLLHLAVFEVDLGFVELLRLKLSWSGGMGVAGVDVGQHLLHGQGILEVKALPSGAGRTQRAGWGWTWDYCHGEWLEGKPDFT